MRLFRLLLRLFPRSFRERFGESMVDAFRQEVEHARRHGRAAAMWLRVKTVAHLVVGAPAEWSVALRSDRSPSNASGPGLRRSTVDMVASVLADARHAVWTCRAQPGFTAIVVVTLALGIGANTAIFSVVNTVLLRPLPFGAPEDLAFIWGRMSETSVSRAPLSGPDLVDFRERADLFHSFAAVFSGNSTLSGDYEAEQIRLGNATTNLFETLGADPVLGRGFVPEDNPEMSPSVFNDPTAALPPTSAVLSYDLWQRRYGGDEDVLGRTVRVNGQSATIVGVAPAGFRLYMPADASMPGEVDLWLPLALRLDAGPRDSQWLVIMGRKRSDVTWAQAQAQLDVVAAQLRDEHQFHANVGMHLDVRPMHADVVRHVRPILMALLGAVGFVLLISCANVANLLLARAGVREREIAIRRALGGGRLRIVRQMFTESVVLALAGGALGVAVAVGGVELLIALRPEHLPRVEHVGVDGRVLGVTVVVSFLAALLFGTAPAVHAVRPDPSSALAERGGTGSHRAQRLKDALVVTEVALSLVLLIGAGLMLRTFSSLRDVDPGFRADSVLTVTVVPPFFKYRSHAQRLAFFRQVKENLAAIPGVEIVGGVSPLPLTGQSQLWFGPYALTESEEEWSRNEVDYRVHVPGYFEALGTDVLEGRVLTDADNAMDAEPVVAVDEKLALRAWGEETPIGKRILVMRPDTRAEEFVFERYWARVVGVVEHIRYDDLRTDSRETVYFPLRDWSFAEVTFTIRTRVDPVTLAADARDAVLASDPDVAPAAVRPFREYVDDATAAVRFALVLIAFFAGVALVLATVGLYGVVSYAVTQRTREIGIRMAFGAREQGILKLILGKGMALTVAGVLLGLGGALLLTRTLATVLYGVSPTDPATFGALALFLGLVTLLASWIPALRATRIDPVRALAAE